MKKSYIVMLFAMALIQLQCDKILPCNLDICSKKRSTKMTVTNQDGLMGTYTNNDGTRWMIVLFDFNDSNQPVNCIICGDIPDSLKDMSKRVVFSGELKDACGVVDGWDDKEFYIVHPTVIR